MAIALAELVEYLDRCLQPELFDDYCPNGLQVEGRPQITRLVTGVTACQALLDAAVACGADAILVHHGYFWRGEDQAIVGMKRRRLATLLGSEISLLAYHLPLDAHREFGNNACLGRLLGLPPGDSLVPNAKPGLGNVADLVTPITAADLLATVSGVTGRPPLFIGDSQRQLRRVAWCTGAAQGFIEQAVAAGADIYVTGEASEQTVHVARECGIGFIAAGHHATERYGVQALGDHLAEALALEHHYIEIDNPV
jgi:dinuclear metal center YbgI/SA1388 family protein